MQKLMKVLYEGIMILLVIITIMTIWTENTYNTTINWLVWAIFFADFLIRIGLSKNKWFFLKSNPFLLVAVIPFDQFFQIARVVRVFYFFRIKTIAKYYIIPYVKKINIQSLSVITFSLLCFFFIESLLIWRIEPSITFYWEGLYVTFGYLLFFGHQLFEIDHFIVVWLLTINSIIGVVIQGLAIQWAFIKADSIYTKWKNEKSSRHAS